MRIDPTEFSPGEALLWRHGVVAPDDTLRRAAEAMDCVVVYALVPRTSLNEMVDQRARALALEAIQRVSHSMALEDQQVDRDLEKRIRTYIDTALRDRDLWE